MPLYEYECAACGQRFEIIQKFSDPPADTCRKCGQGPVHKLLSAPAIQFKGSGWYITDYARKGDAAFNPPAAAAGSSDKPGTSDKPASADKAGAPEKSGSSGSSGSSETSGSSSSSSSSDKSGSSGSGGSSDKSSSSSSSSGDSSSKKD